MVSFEVWAPHASDVHVDVLGSRCAMRRQPRGWWVLDVPDAAHGTDYAYVVDGGEPTPDPRSRWQPHGVHGPSRVHDPATLPWSDGTWRGVSLPGAVIYELHVGTFTAEGTFDAAIEHLDHLVELGIDLVEVMPVAAFPGRHGWGYDGVHLYAVHEPYGGPDAFARFVDACHAAGSAWILDVVYNHLGPERQLPAPLRAVLLRQAPHAVGPGRQPRRRARRRRCAAGSVDNALMWLRDYHVDGLRLDAVHALADESATHLLEQLATEVDALSAAVRRPLTLIAESDLNDPRLVTGRDGGGYGLPAQWLDDFHHAVHALLTGEGQGYYGDFAADPYAAVEKTLRRAYFHDGTWSSFRGRLHGRPLDTSRVPAYRFVTYLQDHDQVGNRATGDRIGATVSPGLLRIGPRSVLTSPFTPMLFMGEEWGASTPWMYFTDHEEPALADAVRQGRRREFAEHGWAEEDVPTRSPPTPFAGPSCAGTS
jgi:maltooligosyltrehalose trehalohydrolase